MSSRPVDGGGRGGGGDRLEAVVVVLEFDLGWDRCDDDRWW